MIIDVVKILLPTVSAFFIGIGITPIITHFLYKNEMWKKKAGKAKAIDGHTAEVFNKLHEKKEVGTPRMGGTVIWLSAFIVTAIIWILAFVTSSDALDKLEFVSRNQTWVPFAVLLIGALVGLLDDYLEVKGFGGNIAGGLSWKKRVSVVGLLALAVALWFFLKLDVTSIGIPFDGALQIGWLIVPLFVVVALAIYSSGVIDGVDGLSGGVFATIFAAYGIYAFSLGQVDLAAFCGLIVGGLLAFIWFNIPPARFYMTETGTMALTLALAVVAFMTDSLGGGNGILLLPIIAMPLVVTSGSVVLQITHKKMTGGRKIFHSTPIHHHFEALGWPNYKVTMRYWIFSVIFATFGLVLALLS